MNNIYSLANLSYRHLLLLSFIFCFVFLSVISFAQESEADNIKTLQELFQYIENQGKYKIFYQNDHVDVNRKITIDQNQTDMSKLLAQALEGTGLSFKIIKDHIVITTKKDNVAQQDETIVKGCVTDNTGETLIGVTVMIKGTTIGTITNLDGIYELEVENLNDTLVFSYIGFEKVIQPINGRTEINIIMQMASFALDEVVAIGYGIKKQTDIIGAVSVVNSKEISALPVSNVSEALQGKATGVSVTQNTGAPGTGTSIRIRGTGTINNNSPLYIIDGVPTKDANTVSPSDIESISILKDAASSSIFGSRASNGVILITTKKGKEGSMSINFNTYTGLQVVSNLTEMCNKDQYIEIFNEAATNDGRSLITTGMADTMPNTNWWKEIFRPAIITSADLSVSGGGKNINYLVSGNYFYQEGIILNSGYDRFSFRTSVNSELSKKVNIGTNISLSSATTNQVGSSGDGYGGNGGSVVRYA
ncbi:MAG: SusC/RagA family TonB-linked outer membrane protein, partial [Mariniphaga sp.]|nr:SusC/RagA family TonB-linked outer membrane protein [Mariniphaga sp.]